MHTAQCENPLESTGRVVFQIEGLRVTRCRKSDINRLLYTKWWSVKVTVLGRNTKHCNLKRTQFCVG